MFRGFGDERVEEALLLSRARGSNGDGMEERSTLEQVCHKRPCVARHIITLHTRRKMGTSCSVQAIT
jgi:hypothetical protein